MAFAKQSQFDRIRIFPEEKSGLIAVQKYGNAMQIEEELLRYPSDTTNLHT
jgi:hypothetical protein